MPSKRKETKKTQSITKGSRNSPKKKDVRSNTKSMGVSGAKPQKRKYTRRAGNNSNSTSPAGKGKSPRGSIVSSAKQKAAVVKTLKTGTTHALVVIFIFQHAIHIDNTGRKMKGRGSGSRPSTPVCTINHLSSRRFSSRFE